MLLCADSQLSWNNLWGLHQEQNRGIWGTALSCADGCTWLWPSLREAQATSPTLFYHCWRRRAVDLSWCGQSVGTERNHTVRKTTVTPDHVAGFFLLLLSQRGTTMHSGGEIMCPYKKSTHFCVARWPQVHISWFFYYSGFCCCPNY